MTETPPPVETRKPASLLVLADAAKIYSPAQQKRIAELTKLLDGPLTAEEVHKRDDLLARVELIFSGWGAATLDEDFLAKAPDLKVLFYGAGAMSGVMTWAAYERGIVATSAWVANAVPVAEYTLGAILLSLKQAPQLMRRMHDLSGWAGRDPDAIAGACGSRVALISLGVIGRKVAQLLKPFDVEVVAFDPLVTQQDADELSVRLVSLAEAFSTADVVSLHTPWLPETEGMVTGELVGSMRHHATLINTSRGAVVREDELTRVLEKERKDLTAILDVTHPEPPAEDSSLFMLPNVFLTPHIAGSMGKECHRMGQYMLDELERYLAGEQLQWAVPVEMARNSTHRPKR